MRGGFRTDTFDGVFIVLFIVGIVLLPYGIQRLVRRRKIILRGTPTTGKIQGTCPANLWRYSGYMPRYYYVVEYDLDGRKQRGRSLQCELGSNPMSKNRTVNIMVNPDKPEVVYIRDEQRGELNFKASSLTYLAIGIAFVAVSIVGIALGW